MTTTRTRSPDRRDTRSSGAREGAERRPIILVSAGIVLVLLIFAATVTSAGHVVLAASQHFLLQYSGVFALLALTGSVCMGVVATNRIIMTPGHRVLAQAVHRATSFGALAFLIIHIVLEIAARHLEESTTQHVHVLDAFIPFLSQYRTFYMAEGTIASDIIVLLVVTSILRRRFTSSGNAWKWRAIHYSSYAALILGVLHGLLAGRKAIGSFVYWSYGIVILLVALAVLVRILATSLRNKEIVKSAAPPSEPGGTGSTQFDASARCRAGPDGPAHRVHAAARPDTRDACGDRARYSHAAGGPLRSGSAAAGAPGHRRAAGPGPGGTAPGRRAPRYEPGYDGPPRYEGAPSPRPSNRTGPQPGHATRSQPAYGTGPMPAYRADVRPPRGTGAPPPYGTGPMPAYRADVRPPRGQALRRRTGPAPCPPTRRVAARRTGHTLSRPVRSRLAARPPCPSAAGLPAGPGGSPRGGRPARLPSRGPTGPRVWAGTRLPGRGGPE